MSFEIDHQALAASAALEKHLSFPTTQCGNLMMFKDMVPGILQKVTSLNLLLVVLGGTDCADCSAMGPKVGSEWCMHTPVYSLAVCDG